MNQHETLDTVLKVRSLIYQYFNGDSEKVILWLDTPNPNLGNISPDEMINLGRVENLLKFVETQLEESGVIH